MTYNIRTLLPNTYNADLEEFIKTHGDKRITQKAFTYFTRPDRHGIVVVAMCDQYMVGISGSTLTADESITVTHNEYRNMGIGTYAMGLKIKVIGPEIFKAVVAIDNLPSNRICRKNQMLPMEVVERTRTSGTFLANVYEVCHG